MKLIDLKGQRFEKAVVQSRAPNWSASDTNARWLCLCDCGKEFITYGQDLRRGKVKSCGCFTRKTFGQRAGAKNRTHGMSRTAMYQLWDRMHRRCDDPKRRYYNGMGVTVCDRWHSFENFLSDMGVNPGGMTLDRINPHGDYSPDNCRWATHAEQANNRRKPTLKLSNNGVTLSVSDWAKVLGVSYQGMYSRLYKKFSSERLFAGNLRNSL